MARRRTRSRERGEKSDEGTLQEGDASEGSLSYGELKAEVRSLVIFTLNAPNSNKDS